MQPQLNTAQPAPMVTQLAPTSDFDRLLSAEYGVRQIMQGDDMDKMLVLAEQMAAARVTVPKHLQGSVADCLAIVIQAAQWGMNHYSVAQKTHIVNGVLGYEAQLVNAVVQNSGAIRGAFKYEFTGEGQNVRCRVGAVLRNETEITWGMWLSASSVQTKNSPLWKTNPAQQLGYLQVKNWARAYCPGAILGVYTPDELEDFSPVEKTADPAIARGPQRRAKEAPAAANDVPADTSAQTEGNPPADEQAPPEEKPTPPATTQAPPAGVINAGQVKYLQGKLKAAGIDEASIVERFQLAGLEHMSLAEFDTLKSELLAMG